MGPVHIDDKCKLCLLGTSVRLSTYAWEHEQTKWVYQIFELGLSNSAPPPACMVNDYIYR